MKLSVSRIQLLSLLIQSEPTITSKVRNNNKEHAKKVSITEDGSVMFFYGSGPIWWQKLFNTYESVSIIDAAIRIADAITGSNGARNEIAFDSITKSILDEAIKRKDLDCVVDILFDTMRNCSDGELHSKWINQENIKKYAKENNVRYNCTVDGDITAFGGIRMSDGRIIPVMLGKVTKQLY